MVNDEALSVADVTPMGPTIPFGVAWRDSDETHDRRIRVWELGFEGDARAYRGIENALSDPDVEVRREAVWALARLGEIKSMPLLDRALRDRDREVRQMAAEVLSSLRKPSALRR